MLIVENPLVLLYIALGILIFFLLLFKIVNYLDSIKAKEKPKKDEKKSEAVNAESKIETKEEQQSDDVVVDPKNMTNYLYDRFVTTPTTDDAMVITNNISTSFLTEEKYCEIRDKKVKINVEPVYQSSFDKENLYKKIEQLTNNNRSEKERMLEEFNNLSKEMKLLLIENIMQKID